MVMFHSCVKLPEGKWTKPTNPTKKNQVLQEYYMDMLGSFQGYDRDILGNIWGYHMDTVGILYAYHRDKGYSIYNGLYIQLYMEYPYNIPNNLSPYNKLMLYTTHKHGRNGDGG